MNYIIGADTFISEQVKNMKYTDKPRTWKVSKQVTIGWDDVLPDPPQNNSETTKKVLSYVPSAVFPSLIFPAVFYENNNLILFSSEIQAFILAFIVSVIFKNIFLTVSVGILSYILIIFG